MSIPPVSAPVDPYAAPPVNQIGQEPARKGPREKPSDRHGHDDQHVPPAETPSEGAQRAPGSDSVGTMIDVRV